MRFYLASHINEDTRPILWDAIKSLGFVYFAVHEKAGKAVAWITRRTPRTKEEESHPVYVAFFCDGKKTVHATRGSLVNARAFLTPYL
jgi:hypothetical protein